MGSFFLVFRFVSHGFILPWDDAGIHLIFETAGGQHFTGTVSNKATSEMGHPVWPTGRTCDPISGLLKG